MKQGNIFLLQWEVKIMGGTYIEVVEAIGSYYGTNSDIWQKVATSGAANLTPEEINAIRQVPGVNVTVTNSGAFRGWDYDNPFPSSNNPASSVNSNVPNSTYGGSSFNGRINGTYHWDAQTQSARLTSGARNVSTGARVATVAGKLNTAVTAVAAGMFLGAKIDSALYNVGKFFDLNPPSSLDPNTWDNIASTEGGKNFIRHLFHIDGNSGTTAYMPEDALEYMYRYWFDLGLWNTGQDYVSDYPDNFTQSLKDKYALPLNVSTAPLTSFTYSGNTYYIRNGNNSSPVYTVAYQLTQSSPGSYVPIMVSRAPFKRGLSNTTPDFTPGSDARSGTFTISGVTYTYYYYSPGWEVTQTTCPIYTGIAYGNTVQRDELATLILYGEHTIESGIDGATPDPNETSPGAIDPAQPILPQLKQNMPNQFTNPIKETVPQSDGTNKEIVYYPVPWPKITDNTEKPTTGTSNQTDPTITPSSPSDETAPLTDVITNPTPQPETPTPGGPATPPDTGSGSTPTVVPPTGNASSLWAIYNPTQAQLDAFGAWLWSSDFVEQIKKLFNDPMQAIVGVHKVFATPSTGSQVNIKCGYIDSGCPAAAVTNQYTTINCGTVNVREYYGNVLDYSPYTEISLYLPFIGIVKLDISDVMRGSVTVIYHVDVITGACLADVIINRDGENAVMYQYSGSAIVTYPISSGSYASMVTGVLSLAAGVAGTIMTGGAAAPALIGGAVGLSHLHTDVQKSGGFSGSPGAMGCKKPYLIISRSQDAMPTNFEHYEGKPASKSVTLGNCDGFVKVKSINIDGVPATYGELDQIVALLKQGVII